MNGSLNHTLNVKEAALLLGFSELTVRRLVRAKTLPCFRSSVQPKAHIRFRRADLLRYMNGEQCEEKSCAA